MYSIRRFGVIRTATIVAVIYMIVVAVVFVPIAVIAVLASVAGAAYSGDATVAGAGLAGVVVLGFVGALFYGAMGWVFTAIACLIYNVAAKWVGGIEVQVDRVEPKPVPVVPAWTIPPSAPGAPPVG